MTASDTSSSTSDAPAHGGSDKSAPSVLEHPPKRRRWWSRWLRRIGFLLLLFIVLLAIARPFMPMAVRWYVNRVLSSSEIYKGKIRDIDIHLWRGAYSIRGVSISKTTGAVPVPLFAADSVDLAVEWPAMLHRKIVGQVVMNHAQLNFVDDPGSGEGQSGAGGPWLAIIRDLFPFQINSVHIHDGEVHFRTFASQKPVDVFLDQMEATVDDLSNISRSVTPLITTINANATAMHDAKFQLRIKLDPFSYDPTFHLTLRLLGLDVTKTNDLVRAYGGFDFKRGWFDLVTEIDVKEGLVDGYVKPLFRDLKVFDLMTDIKEDDAPQVFWQAMVGAVAEVLKNHPRDQVATIIPLTGSLNGPQPDILAAVGNVLENAFIRAYLPRLERTRRTTGDVLQFGAPSITDPISGTEAE